MLTPTADLRPLVAAMLEGAHSATELLEDGYDAHSVALAVDLIEDHPSAARASDIFRQVSA